MVDVYVNRPAAPTKGSIGAAEFAGPDLALEGITVVGLSTEDGVMGGARDTRTVQVMVPKDNVKELVGDVDLGAKITLVAVPGALAPKTS